MIGTGNGGERLLFAGLATWNEFPAVEIPERRRVRSVACREALVYDTCI